MHNTDIGGFVCQEVLWLKTGGIGCFGDFRGEVANNSQDIKSLLKQTTRTTVQIGAGPTIGDRGRKTGRTVVVVGVIIIGRC